MVDHRLVDTNGNRLSFTCENHRYCTDVAQGESHGTYSLNRGSVFDQPLVSGDYSLWLEHVIEKKTNERFYWLMWYEKDGVPTIPISGILDKDDIHRIARRLTVVP